MLSRKFSTLIFIIFCSFFIFSSNFVQAKSPEVIIKDPTSYSAKFISQSVPDPISIEAGETKNVTITFKNIGNKPWVNTGKNYISAYTMEPRYRASHFSGKGWLSTKQTAKMSGTINPGQTGSITIPLHAPQKTGEYIEKFYLASENRSWVNKGYFYLKINVVEKKKEEIKKEVEKEVEKKESEINEIEIKESQDYKAKKLAQSIKTKKVLGGEKIKVIAIFQNTGDSEWKDYSLIANRPDSVASISEKLSFANDDWVSHTEVVSKTEVVEKFGVIREEFFVRAPKKSGKYNIKLALKVGDSTLIGSDVLINLDVTQNAPLNYKEPSFGELDTNSSDSKDNAPKSIWLDSEPTIRVGMAAPMDYAEFISKDYDYKLTILGTEYGLIPAGQVAIMSYDGIYYKVKTKEFSYEDEFPPRLEPVDDVHAIFEVSNFSRYVKWKGPNNFNKYRGALEYREGVVDKKMYLVNDLLLEDYVAGIAETSNRDPKEYIRALLTAARTYAYKSLGKYSFFDVLGNTYDQLYLGYVSEDLMPYVAQAARDTRGYMVTYDKQVVITPYYANSTGKTKTWRSVWGGTDKAWLQPVSANYDIGQRLRGHGVGMSARDAAIRADKEGVDWTYLIKYYYTGVEVLKIFN